MQLQPSLSQGSSDSHNSTFFKTPTSGDFALSASNTTEDTGLLSALTRIEVDELKSVVSQQPLMCGKSDLEQCDEVSKSGNVNKNSDLILRENELIEGNECSRQRGRSPTTRAVANSEDLTSRYEIKNGHFSECDNTHNVVMTPDGNVNKEQNLSRWLKKQSVQEIYKNGTMWMQKKFAFKKYDQGKTNEMITELAFNQNDSTQKDFGKVEKRLHEQITTAFNSGIDGIKDKIGHCNSSRATVMFDRLHDFEMEVIDFCEPTSLKENCRAFNTSMPELEPVWAPPSKNLSAIHREQGRKHKQNNPNIESIPHREHINHIEGLRIETSSCPDTPSIRQDSFLSGSLLAIIPPCCKTEKYFVHRNYTRDRSLSPDKCCNLDGDDEPCPISTRQSYLYPNRSLSKRDIASNSKYEGIHKRRPYSLSPSPKDKSKSSMGRLRNAGALIIPEEPEENLRISHSSRMLAIPADELNIDERRTSSNDPPCVPQSKKVMKPLKTVKSSIKQTKPKWATEKKSGIHPNNKVSHIINHRKKAFLAKRNGSQLGNVQNFNWKKKIYS